MISTDEATRARNLYLGRVYPCPGGAHATEIAGNQDHCTRCAPNWGEVPAHEAISPEARWVLDLLAGPPFLRCPGMPDQVMDAAYELKKFGLAKIDDVFEKRGCGEVAFLAVSLTDDGHMALALIALKHGPKPKRLRKR